MKNITALRSKVMTIANRIRKSNKLSLSQAVKRAWNMAKMGLIIKVAGITQGNRQLACEHLQKYNIADIKVELVREANNPHDKNAIAINKIKQYDKQTKNIDSRSCKASISNIEIYYYCSRYVFFTYKIERGNQTGKS